jgi:multiple sugar transport system permease protein
MSKQKYSYSDMGLIVCRILLIVGAVVMAVPFLWMLLTAFKTYAESTSINPFVIFPEKLRFDAFFTVTRSYNFGRLYYNTLAMIAGRVFFAILTASMAGYALGRLNFLGRSLCFALVLGQMMVPSQIFIIPQYLLVVKLSALNSLFALIFPGLVTAFGTFLLRQHFMSLPSSLDESAQIDGANPLQVFIFIMMPMANSGMVALGIFTALFAYKELMWPLIVNTANEGMPLSSALAKLQGQSITYFPELMAAATLACIPMIIIYLVFQKRFIEGIASTGLKL